MKKLSTLLLTLVMLLMVMMHVAPKAQAVEGEQASLTYTIVNEANPNGTNSGTVEVTLGNEVGISLGVNEQFGYYIHAGDMITDASQKFIASASNHVVVVIKDSPSDTVATFVDTNGEFLGAIYNPTLDSKRLDIAVSKPGFNFVGFDDLEAGVDKVYVAKYTRTNQDNISVTVEGGLKDLDVVKYNDIVTVTPNASGFSYWADSDGQVVSRQANYTFTALQDVELTAVFDDPAPSEPVVYLSNVTGISPDTKSFLGYVEGDFIEYGLLASDKEEVLTLETEDVTVIPSKALHPETNEFLRSIPNDTNLKSFRAYAKLASGEVFYSDNNFVLKEAPAGASYTETFDNSNAPGSYSDGTFKGVNGVTWSYVHSRNEGDYSIDEHGIMLRRSDEPSSLEVKLVNGIHDFSFEYRKAFTGGTLRTYKVDVTHGGTTKTYDIDGFGSGGGEDDTVHTFSYSGLPLDGEVDIKIYASGSDGNQQATFDNFEWTEYGEVSKYWEKLYQHRVTFDLNGGTGYIPDQQILEGDFAIKPQTDPTHETLIFAGWFTEIEGDDEFDFDATTINNDLVLYAKWTDTSLLQEHNLLITLADLGPSGGSYAKNTGTKFTNETIDFIANIWLPNSGDIQGQANNFNMYNLTSLTKIQTIVLTLRSTSSFALYAGNQSNTTSNNITPTISGTVYTFDLNDENYSYFKIQNQSGVIYIETIEIVYFQ